MVAEVNRQKSQTKATDKENLNPYVTEYKNISKFAQAYPNILLTNIWFIILQTLSA